MHSRDYVPTDWSMFLGKLASLFLFCSFVPAVFAAPTRPEVQLDELQGITKATPLSPGLVASFEPFALFAKAAYCSSKSVQEWTCGKACNMLSDFKPTLTGGDGDLIQFYYVGHWPKQNTIVVVHQGTDPLELQPFITDLKFVRASLNGTLFSGAPEEVTVHDGFRIVHERTAPAILNEVKRLMEVKQTRKVALVGHSLGGALAALDALYLKLNLPEVDIDIKAVTFAIPRIGNEAFAKFFDEKVPNFKRINYGLDIIPIMPGRFLGYRHTKGEIHLIKNGPAIACPGNDDATDERCQIKSVSNILKGNFIHHLGPFPGGTYMGGPFCGSDNDDDASILGKLVGLIGRDLAARDRAGLRA